MSEINQDMQGQGLTPEQELALEAERAAAWEAMLAPARAERKRLTDVEDVVAAIAGGIV